MYSRRGFKGPWQVLINMITNKHVALLFNVARGKYGHVQCWSQLRCGRCYRFSFSRGCSKGPKNFRGLSKHHAGFGNGQPEWYHSGFISAIVTILKWVGGVVLVIGLVVHGYPVGRRFVDKNLAHVRKISPFVYTDGSYFLPRKGLGEILTLILNHPFRYYFQFVAGDKALT